MTSRRQAPADRTGLTAAAVAAMIEQLRGARRQLLRREPDDVVRALGRVAELWLTDDDRRQGAAREIARSTGYAPAMVELCLRRTFRAWGAPHLEHLLESALADVRLDTPGVPDTGVNAERRRIATAPELVLAILAQNTPGLAIAPVFTALALRAAIVVKSARGETHFAPLLMRSIAAVDADLGAACAVHTWAGGTAAVEDALFAAVGRIVVYGGAATVAAVRARAGERVVAHGPRASLAVIGGPKLEGFPVATARALAREIAFLDQRGCLSPQLVLVDDRIDREALGTAIARELATIEHEWPRRRLPLDAATTFRRAVDGAEADVLAGNALALHGGSHEPWAVVVEQADHLRATPLDRFVRLHPFAGSDGLASALAPLRGTLECVGIAAPPAALGELATACRNAGAARICALEEMQDPPADWHGGGRPPLVELLSWSTESLPSVARAASDAPAARRDDEPAGRTIERFHRHVAQTSDAPRALSVSRASGSRIFTTDGRSYVDMLAGIGVAAIGHAHPEVARAVARQVERYAHVMVYGEDVLEQQVELATRLAGLLPPSLSVTYFTNSGAEAIEGALKLVRKATQRTRVLAFEGAFHGDTTGALALGGNPFYREPFRPLVDGIEHVAWDCDESLQRIDGSVAAVFAEPVQAEAGVRVPRADFLPRLAARCREVGALLVLDEVVTALGRTGRWFGFEHWPGATPDVLVLAKSLGGGLPLGAFVASSELMAVLAHDPPLGHVTTFGGNPVCCAAALASLDVLERERLPEHAGRLGADLLDRLRALVGRGGLVEVRGLGMLIGLEFANATATQRFVAGCFARGVLLGWTLHHDRVVRLAPPLNIADEDLADALRAIAAALEDCAA